MFGCFNGLRLTAGGVFFGIDLYQASHSKLLVWFQNTTVKVTEVKGQDHGCQRFTSLVKAAKFSEVNV